ncbi:MAG: sigma-70 family RNA polymerase sigma factor [Verrucomicrobia bacterium]|nr:sigma-70 family RNA polymerase sigma factor [Phycisphaerales bacterium]MCZ7635902.1 sigma-70 family RNA polymerase sigma factor [Verrucomicrobiota bacterium]GIK20323.1 MAG: RNA polymerase sigma factor SigD [Planctomycetota bacterium]
MAHEPEPQAEGLEDSHDPTLAAALGGDPDAVRALWQRHRRWVAGVLLAYKPRHADLEDLLQDVAMTFVRRLGGLRDPASLRPWLRSVAINAARLAARKARSRPDVVPARRSSVEHVPQPVNGETPDVLAARREDATRVLNLALELPESYREPLLLRCLHGMSYREIGLVVGLPETTVETRIARGRRMLRELAARHAIGPTPATEGATS